MPTFPWSADPVSLIVQKYGGSSVADAESIKRVAKRIVETRKAGNEVVVVVSRDGRHHRRAARPRPPGRRRSPTRASSTCCSPRASASRWRCSPWRSRAWASRPGRYTGSQAGMITDAQHGSARIVDVTPGRVREALDEGAIAIVAGFQGFNRDSRRHHDARPRRLRHDRRRARRRARRRRLRDLHGCRRRLHRRPARRAEGPQDRPHHERGDARARRRRREGAVHPRGGIRPSSRGDAARALVVQQQRGHLGREPEGGRDRGRAHHHRSRRRPQRGEDHRRRRARHPRQGRATSSRSSRRPAPTST